MRRLVRDILILTACALLTACAGEAAEDPAPTFSVNDEPNKDGSVTAGDGSATDPADAGTATDAGNATRVDAGGGVDADGPCQGDESCPPERFCLNGQCLPDICAPGSAKCANLSRRSICLSNGAGYTNEDCKTGETCEDGACKPEVCKPGQKVCTDNKVITCSARGASWSEAVDCGVDAICIEGSCVSLVCNKGASKCAGNTLVTCKDDGMGWVEKPCPAKSSCDASIAPPACVEQICNPGTIFCAGDKAVSCSANGLKQSQEADCGLPSSDGKKQKCLKGKCVPYGCVPGTKICQDGMVGTCVQGGGGYSLAACPQGQACDGGQCKVLVCVPGEFVCDGLLIKTCISDGTALAVVGKCAPDQACIGKQGKAECVKQLCTPADKACTKDATGIEVCNADGMGTAVYDCPPDQICVQATCVKQLCEPSTKYCSVDWVMKCNLVGSGADKVVQCTDKQSCKGGACLTKLCQAGTAICKDLKNLTVCADPTKGLVDEPCAANTVCNKDKCVPQACAPASKFCEGSQAFLCDASGLTKLMNIDCKFQSKVCSGGECVAPVCGNGQLEPGEECDDGNDKPGDGCSPKCVKEPAQQCKPGETKCCSASGQWLPKGSKCGNNGLLKKYSCSGGGKGAWIMVSQGYPSCPGASGNCNYLNLWWSPPANGSKCKDDEFCKVAPVTGYTWCGK